MPSWPQQFNTEADLKPQPCKLQVMKHHGYLPPSPQHSLRGGRGQTRSYSLNFFKLRISIWNCNWKILDKILPMKVSWPSSLSAGITSSADGASNCRLARFYFLGRSRNGTDPMISFVLISRMVKIDNKGNSVSSPGPASPRTRHPTWSHGHYLRYNWEKKSWDIFCKIMDIIWGTIENKRSLDNFLQTTTGAGLRSSVREARA